VYIDDTSTIHIASVLLIYAAVFQVFDGLQAVGMGILRGLEDTKVPTIIAFCSYTIVALPLGYFLSTSTPLEEQGVWIGYVIALILASSGYVMRIHYKTKKGQV
jgi:MATE family multidrug resistance protein